MNQPAVAAGSGESEPRWHQALALLAWAAFAALAALPLWLIRLRLPLNYNEGWNAYFADAAMRGTALYPPADAMLANNYPPLSFYLVGALGRLLGDNIVAGRCLCFAAVLALGAGVHALCRRLGARPWAAALGAAQTLLMLYILRPAGLVMDDPQFLAQACAVWAAALFLRAPPEVILGRTILAALLLIAGGLIKHSVIALPFALCICAALHDRRRLGIFVAALLAFGGAALALLYAVWGAALFRDVLLHSRVASLGMSLTRSASLLPYAAPYLAAAALAGWLLRRQATGAFLLGYLAVAAAAGFWMMSGDGTNLNVLYDLAIATGLGVTALGPLLQRAAARRGWNRRLPALAATAVLLPVLLCALQLQRQASARDIDLLRHAGDWSALIARLAQAPGPVACEDLSLCYWAGKPMQVDFFNYGEKLRKGSLGDEAFRQRIARGEFDYVEVQPTSPRLPHATFQWLADHYQVVDGIGDQALLLAPP